MHLVREIGLAGGKRAAKVGQAGDVHFHVQFRGDASQQWGGSQRGHAAACFRQLR